MACGLALKRPYDYDGFMSPDDTSDIKRRRTNTRCSPFRPFLGTLAASLPNASSSPAPSKACSANEGISKNESPFATVANHIQLSPGQLESYLKAEVRYLKRRRLLPKRLFVECSSGERVDPEQRNLEPKSDSSFLHRDFKLNGSSTNNYRTAPHSPTGNSGSDSDGETTASSGLQNRRSGTELSIFDKPQFSLKQVQLICERLLKQQEIRIRFEYEGTLNKLLQEQHDQFVQFTREQEKQRSSDVSEEFSYYS